MKYATLLFFLLPACLISQNYSNPESITFDDANNRYLVSNSNNGQIISRAADGTLSIFK